MKTQELRLGNFIAPNGVIEFEDALDGFVHHVMGPSVRLAVCAILSEKIIAVEAGFRGRMFQQKIDIDDVVSIPLTEELLLKSGFRKFDGCRDSYGSFELDHLELTKCIDDGLFYPTFNGYEYTIGNIPIEFIHQLQNLYFLIVGEELEVKF